MRKEAPKLEKMLRIDQLEMELQHKKIRRCTTAECGSGFAKTMHFKFALL